MDKGQYQLLISFLIIASVVTSIGILYYTSKTLVVSNQTTSTTKTILSTITTTSTSTQSVATTFTTSSFTTSSISTSTTTPECKCSWFVCNNYCENRSGNYCLLDSNCFGTTTTSSTTSTITSSTTSTTIPTTTTSTTTTSTSSTTSSSTTISSSTTTTTTTTLATTTTTTILPRCSDGTLYGQCSITKPKYCDNGNLIDKCSVCSCSAGYTCQVGGTCIHNPNPIITTANVGTYYITGWENGTGQRASDWLIGSEFHPVLGFYKSKNPDIADWHIKWAVENGISFFIIPWTHAGYTWENNFENGLLKSKFLNYVKFALMLNFEPYCSDGSLSATEKQTILQDIGYIANNYFIYNEYLKINNKPVLFVFHARSLAWDCLGGINQLSNFINEIKSTASAYNANIFVVGDVMEPNKTYDDESFAKIFDAVSSYNMMRAGTDCVGVQPCVKPYDSMVSAYISSSLYWNNLTKQVNIRFIPPLTPGFSNKILYEKGIDTWLVERTNPTPEKFQTMVNGVKQYIDSSVNMIVVEAWNEFQESSVIEPTVENGFNYLEVVRNQFS